MIRKEIYRILSRKITLLALVVATAFLLYYGTFRITEEIVIDDGEIYRYSEAVVHDKMIAEEFAGPLTMETVQAIWEKYGEPVNYKQHFLRDEDLLPLAKQGGYDNYCNTLVARFFVNNITQDNGNDILILKGDTELSENRYLNGRYTFGYAGKGWIWYWDQLMMTLTLTSIVVIIAFSPVFSEDYAFRTADIILPTVRGRFQIWRMRTGAGFLFASVYYWLMSAYAFLLNYVIYGGEGLSVSCGFTFLPYDWTRDSDPVWKAILIMHLAGWFSMLVLILQIQAISSKCKSSFMSLLWSLAAYLGPIAVIRTILDNFPVNRLLMWVKYFGYSMPLSFSGMFTQAPSSSKRILLIFALVTAVVTAVLGTVGWIRHQVRN